LFIILNFLSGIFYWNFNAPLVLQPYLRLYCDDCGRYEAELAQASALPLPDDDDEAFES
jgi:hypothetical protein